MRDGFEDPVLEAHKAKITYPFPGGPEQGEAVDVAPGVKWLRMPLGGSLAWINVWAIREAGGWAIVDTGLGGQATRESWRKALAGRTIEAVGAHLGAVAARAVDSAD